MDALPAFSKLYLKEWA